MSKAACTQFGCTRNIVQTQGQVVRFGLRFIETNSSNEMVILGVTRKHLYTLLGLVVTRLYCKLPNQTLLIKILLVLGLYIFGKYVH